MGLQQVGNQNLFGSASVITPATPVFQSNNGVFLSVTRTGAGVYVVVMADNFPLRPDDYVEPNPIGLVAATAHIEARTSTSFQVRMTNGNDVALDLAFSLLVNRTFEG